MEPVTKTAVTRNAYEAELGSDALKNPQRIVFITKKTSAKVKGDAGGKLMSYPNLLLRETVAFQVMTIVLVVAALFWDAPLEQLANPLVTPNPAKAPWYFLGLQELLHYFPPLVAGIVIPTLVVLGLVVIPYFNVNVKGEPLWSGGQARRRMAVFLAVGILLIALFGFYEAWTVVIPTVLLVSLALISFIASTRGTKRNAFLSSKPISWWVMTWFIAVAITLTVVGTFFRGPGWSWVWPWR
jgi:hypothetical protein